MFKTQLRKMFSELKNVAEDAILYDSIPDRCCKYCVVQMQCYRTLNQTDAVSTVLSRCNVT
jgi:hypothetical protein